MSTPSDPFVLVSTSEQEGGSPSMLTDDMSASWVEDVLLWFPQPDQIWSDDDVKRTQGQRSQLPGGKLFLDELLSLAQVDAALYPPTSEQSLSSLLNAIASSSFDSLKRASLVYYLMLDADAKSSSNGMEEEQSDSDPKADSFAQQFFVLPHFKQLMHGYWLLDRGQYDQAISYLTNPNFIPKVIRTLFQSSDRTPLARSRSLLRFLQASTRPSSSSVDSPEHLEELEMQVEATCWVKGPAKAFALVHELAFSVEDQDAQQETRYRLMNRVFEHCFSPPNAVAIKNLLACYLDTEEQIALETFVLSPPASMSSASSYVAADVLIARFINQGRYMDAVRLDRRLGPDVGQGHSSIADPVARAKLLEKRKRMVAGAREILPEVQKELLRIEESMEISADKDKTSAESSQVGELKMSWEQVPSPSDTPISTASKLTPLSASVALRSSQNKTPTTQAALLSAVVRASASPRGASASPARPREMDVSPPSFSPSPAAESRPIGFLASNSLAFGQSQAGNDEDVEIADTPASQQPELTSQPGYRRKEAEPSSPWRNTQPLTTTSPFSGQPKIPTNNFVARFESAPASGSASPFRPANTSPFVTASSSSRNSPFASPAARKLPGGSAKPTRQRYSGEHDVEIESEEEEQGADDTFVGRHALGRSAKPKADEQGKLARSKSSAVLKGKPKSAIPKSKSEVSVKRATRSSSAAKRQPLTLSNLAARDMEDVEAGPIARRTRAATASIHGESVDGASTAYSVSEMGEEQDGLAALPKKRAQSSTRVRRSSRLSSAEPESEKEAPKRRFTRSAKRTMPGALEE